MREIRTSGLMSGDGKRSVAAWPKPPRPSSTLRQRFWGKSQRRDPVLIIRQHARPPVPRTQPHDASPISLACSSDRSAPTCSDPPPVPHQHDAPEQVVFDHQSIEPSDVGLGIDPAQEQGMPDG